MQSSARPARHTIVSSLADGGLLEISQYHDPVVLDLPEHVPPQPRVSTIAIAILLGDSSDAPPSLRPLVRSFSTKPNSDVRKACH